MRCKLLDGVAAVGQYTGIPVDIGDRGIAGSGRQKSWVIGINALTDQASDINNIEARRGFQNGQVSGFAVNNYLNCVFHRLLIPA